MIDPKVVELSVYNGIPHLLIPVVTDPKKAAGALQWAVNEMMDRYKKFADCHVRDMAGYNALIKDGKMEMNINGEKQYVNVKKMPQIVVVVDELADLMMVASKEVEESICRLAQLARAAGIHLIIATQRPSVNVITGLIKANMPSRIAFAVTSGVDSRTILDMVGAERLLGKGDMLYYPQGIPKPLRVQGAFVTDKDVSKVTAFIRDNNSLDEEEALENQKILEQMDTATSDSSYQSLDSQEGGFNNDRDEYFNEAARLLIEKDKGSIGMLQRNFKIGFNRAARIIDQLEEFGVVGPEVGTKPRKILVTLDEFESMIQAEGGR
jgi:S-DNA-T family DNA segregation ATPase FtsK/SpoIIIE